MFQNPFTTRVRRRRKEPLADRHPVDQPLPAGRLLVMGFQHVSIMYAGAIAVPLIVGAALHLDKETISMLVNADLLVAGIATIIQAVGIGKIFGVRLPVVAGATFTVISPMILIAQTYGGEEPALAVVYGAMLVSGVFGILIAPLFARVVRFFPPLVAGTVICVIGLSLIGAAPGMIMGPDADAPAVPRIALAGFVVLLIVLLSRFTRGFVSQIAVLIALVIGTLVAIPMGLVDLSGVGTASWFGVVTPLQFGAPKFVPAAIISMCMVMLVTYTESTADMIAVSEMVGKKLTRGDLARGLATDGLSAVLAGFMNSFPDTAFAENVGLVQMTRVRSRWVVAVAGAILVTLGLVPKVGEIMASIPGPVVGGVAIVMFAMVGAVGIRMLHKVRFEGTHNLLIVATSLGVAMLPAYASEFYTNFGNLFQVIFGSPITSSVIVAFTLNLLFNHWRRGRSEDNDTDELPQDDGAGAAPRTTHDERAAVHG